MAIDKKQLKAHQSTLETKLESMPGGDAHSGSRMYTIGQINLLIHLQKGDFDEFRRVP